jgi:hypothetical protein
MARKTTSIRKSSPSFGVFFSLEVEGARSLSRLWHLELQHLQHHHISGGLKLLSLFIF